MPSYFSFQIVAVEVGEWKGWEPRLGSQTVLDPISALSLTWCAIFGKYLTISVLRFFPLSGAIPILATFSASKNTRSMQEGLVFSSPQMLSFISLVKFLKVLHFCWLIPRYLIMTYDLSSKHFFLYCLNILLGNRCMCVSAWHMLPSVI